MPGTDSNRDDATADELVVRLGAKKQLGVRCPPVIAELMDPLRDRASECGCGIVSRDELVAALLVAAARGEDDVLIGAIELFRRTRLNEISRPDDPAEEAA